MLDYDPDVGGVALAKNLAVRILGGFESIYLVSLLDTVDSDAFFRRISSFVKPRDV